MEWNQGTLIFWKYPQKSCYPLGLLAHNRDWLDYQMTYHSNLQLKRLQSYKPSSWQSRKYFDFLGSRLRFSRFRYCKLGLRAIRVRFPVTANFESPQFCSRRACRVKNKFFWKIWSIFISISGERGLSSVLNASFALSKYLHFIS